MEHPIEQFLLFRIRAFQDQKAFEAIVKEIGPKVERFLKLRLDRQEDREDLYGDIWTRFWAYAQSTKIESASGIIHTIARGAVAEFYRNRTRRPEHLTDNEDQSLDVPTTLGEKMLSSIDMDLLWQVMRELKVEDVQLIQMRYLEGYRIKEIAKLLGKTENVVSVTLNRAINKLRKKIQEKFSHI